MEAVTSTDPTRSPQSLRLLAWAGPAAPDATRLLGWLSGEGLATELVDMLPDDAAVPAVLVICAPGDPAAINTAADWRGRQSAAPMLLGCAPGGTSDDAEAALAAGFDDFVVGAVSGRELAARVRVLARRWRPTPSPRQAPARVRFGRLELDRERHEAWLGARCLKLTPLELEFLWTLAAAAGRTLDRASLLDAVWGGDNLEVGVRAVDNLALRLRRKLHPDDGLLVTVRGVGFRLAP